MDRPATRPAALVAAIACLVAPACSGDDGDAEPVTESSTPPVEVTAPPQRSTPFCESMIALGDRLVTDPPDDVTALVIETYESVLADVPDEIRPDFEYVLASLRGDPLPSLPEPTAPVTTPPSGSTTASAPPATLADGSPAPTTSPGADEFILADDTPAERLNTYVEFTCRGTLNNPGPPPTTPDVEIEEDDDL